MSQVFDEGQESHRPMWFGNVTPPFWEEGCHIGAGAVVGVQPMANAANRRPVREVGAGRIGARTIIGCHATVYAGVFIGRDCRLGEYASVREDCRIGDRCVIGTNADIQYGALIGDDVRILNGTQIAGGTVIGNGTFIGPGVQTANHRHVDLKNYDNPPEGRCAPIIGAMVMIGVGAILLPGVMIGDGAVIAAGALVTRDVPAGAFVVGMPAYLVHPGEADKRTAREKQGREARAWVDRVNSGDASALAEIGAPPLPPIVDDASR